MKKELEEGHSKKIEKPTLKSKMEANIFLLERDKREGKKSLI